MKTVWVQAHRGSNPFASAITKKCEPTKRGAFFCYGEARDADRAANTNIFEVFFLGCLQSGKNESGEVRRRAKRDAFALPRRLKEG